MCLPMSTPKPPKQEAALPAADAPTPMADKAVTANERNQGRGKQRGLRSLMIPLANSGIDYTA